MEELMLEQFATALDEVEDDIAELETEYAQTNEALLALLATLAGAYAWSKDNPIPTHKIDIMKLQRQLYQRLERLSTVESKVYKQSFSKVAQAGFNRTAFVLEQSTGMPSKFKPMSKKKEQEIVNLPYKGLTVQESAGVSHQKMIRSIKQILVKGMEEGKDISVMANELSERTSVSLNESKRIIRTEAVRIWTDAQVQSWKNAGFVKKVKFVATVDSKTSDICKGKHGNIYELETMLRKDMPPIHPNCRSILVAVIEDLQKLQEKERLVKKHGKFKVWQKANIG